ncbi:MAG: hypothetical protein COA42_17815 [Alteromonadaceae bacterium]|nr:MAG: hypothetical protein COA42_17815 [Alteromonadaceae bacterium]
MKRLPLLTTASCIALAVSLFATTASAYEINGSSDTKFVLKCNDGTTNTSSMPPNHNTSTAFCADHGGIAAGYPKQVVNAQKAKRLAPSSSITETGYKSSRSNKSSNH